MNKKKTRKALDLFAGCGGLSNGFEPAGYSITAGNEIWLPAALTYCYNHPLIELVGGDTI